MPGEETEDRTSETQGLERLEALLKAAAREEEPRQAVDLRIMREVQGVAKAAAISAGEGLIPRRGHSLKAGLGVFLAAAAILLACLFFVNTRRSRSEASASIIELEGKAELVIEGRTVPAKPGDIIEPGQGVHTDPGARIGLRYPDGTVLDCSEESRLSLQRGASAKRLVLTRGEIRADVRRQPAGWPMVLITPHAEVEVLGTRFVLYVAPSSTRVEVTEGKVRMTREEEVVEVGKGCFAVAVVGMALTAGPVQAGTDWPQLQRDPQRTGYTTEEVAPPFKVAWFRNFQPERVSRHTQAVVYRGRVYVPTHAGTIYALGARDGKVAWKARARSPVEHTAACGDGKVVVAAMDGRVLAFEAETGRPAWRFAAPRPIASFSQAPLIAEGKVFVTSRQGILYALGLADGKLVWQSDVRVPCHNTAAYDGGRVYVGGEDIRIRAFDARNGKALWTSEQLYGQSLKEYHPVVAGGYVLVRPMPVHPSREFHNSNHAKDPAKRADYVFQCTWDRPWAEVLKGKPMPPEGIKMHPAVGKLSDLWQNVFAEVKAGKMPRLLLDAQEALARHYRSRPYDQDFFVLNQSDGKQAYVAPHFHLLSLCGPVAPPAVTADGTVILPWFFITSVWVRFDLKKQRAIEIILPPKLQNPDNNSNFSVAGGKFFNAHMCGGHHFHGAFDFTTRKWHELPRAPGYWGEMSDACESGGNAAAIARGFVYHINYHQLTAWTTAKGETR